jgi:SSS family transporter
MNWIAVGLSIFASSFSALFFIGLPREAAYEDYHFLWAILFIPLVVLPIVGAVFVPLYHRLGLTSAYEYLERRFNRPVRLFASLLFSLYLFGWLGDILYVLGVILQTLFQWSNAETTWVVVGIGVFVTLYTTMGGIKGVIWADAVQAVVLAACIVLLVAGAVTRVDGGWTTVWEKGRAHGKLEMLDFRFDMTKRNTVFAAWAYALFVYLSAYTTAQTAVQRYVSMPSVAATRRSLAMSGLVTTAICALFLMLGTCVFAFYHQALPPGSAAGSGFPILEKKDQLLPYFVQTEVHFAGFTGLFLAGLFASGFSSLDAGLNSLTACVLCDWFPNRKLPVHVLRAMSALFGAGVIGSALLVPVFGETVFDILIKIAGTCFGPLLGLFLLGAFVPRANAAGAIIGLFAGLATIAIVIIFSSITPWWYGAVTCIPTIVIGAIASIGFAPPKFKHLAGLTYYSREKPVLSEG